MVVVEGDEGSHLPNCQTNAATFHHERSFVLAFVNVTAYHLGRHKPSSPSSNELNGLFFLKMDQIRPIFVYFRSFHTTNKVKID